MSKSLAESYRWMMQQEAWADLMAQLAKIETDSTKDLDIMPVEHLSATVAAHGRGMRDAVKKIRSHVDYALGGGPQ